MSSWVYPLFLWITLLSTVYMLLNILICMNKLLLVVNHPIAESLFEITPFVWGIMSNTEIGTLAWTDLTYIIHNM
ncbi:MAG: hypothetical protein ACI9LX_003781 [Paraglaciecola sp.]|jgi:hypothetical protein